MTVGISDYSILSNIKIKFIIKFILISQQIICGHISKINGRVIKPCISGNGDDTFEPFVPLVFFSSSNNTGLTAAVYNTDKNLDLK